MSLFFFFGCLTEILVRVRVNVRVRVS